MDFMKLLAAEKANTELVRTENGALGHKSTGSKLLDMNFFISSYRNMSEIDIAKDFIRAYAEDEILALKWMFYARDARGGAGEVRLFRVLFSTLASVDIERARKLLPLLPEYGKWEDVVSFVGSSLHQDVLTLIKTQLNNDLRGMREEKPISLLGKWLPSITATSKESRETARVIAKELGYSEKKYRKTLSALREYLDVVEKKMTSGNWNEISYNAVPSKANILYRYAFLKHDEERRTEFLDSLKKGEEKINSSVNFPHDVAVAYRDTLYRSEEDDTLEALWKALPDYSLPTNTLIVADGSGSMHDTIGNTSVMAIDVSTALAAYFAERNVGAFKNQFITFSQRPKLVNIGNGSLKSKLRIIRAENEIANTNIKAVFQLILNTAVKNKLSQGELPETILIISDMEFDTATSYRVDATLFSNIKDMYESHGYKLPKLVFWNVMSRNRAIPLIENECGVALISGFSPSAINMALTGEFDALKALKTMLNTERYALVEKAIA